MSRVADLLPISDNSHIPKNKNQFISPVHNLYRVFVFYESVMIGFGFLTLFEIHWVLRVKKPFCANVWASER